jgi:hypothetical protein
MLTNPVGGSASMTNIGARHPIYKTGTATPFQVRTIGAESPSGNILDYGFQATLNANDIAFKYNPLRGNTLYVDATYGNDLTAIVNHEDACFATITEAVAAAQIGDLVIVNSGFYDCAAAVGNTYIWKDGVNIYFKPQAYVNVGTNNWDFNATITQNTGIYGYAEWYIDGNSHSPAPNAAGFLAGFDVPVGYIGAHVPTTTFEINNLYFTNSIDIQNLIVRFKANVNIRNNIYGTKSGTGAGWIYVEGNTSQINVTFQTCYGGTGIEVGQILNVDPKDIKVNASWKQIRTKDFAPSWYVIRLTGNAASPYPASEADPDANNPIGIVLSGDIIHENTDANTYSDHFTNIIIVQANVWAEIRCNIIQKYNWDTVRIETKAFDNTSRNVVLKFTGNTVVMPDANNRGFISEDIVADAEINHTIILDNVTLVMAKNTATLADATVHKWFNGNAASWVRMKIYELKTNVNCASASDMFDNGGGSQNVTLDTPIGWIKYNANINN